jgi:hypothetical protein
LWRALQAFHTTTLRLKNRFGHPIFWNGIFMAVNSVQLLILWQERRGIEFSEEQKEMYQMIFKNFFAA